MQLAGPLDDHTAEIIIAGDFLALSLARDHIGARLRRGIEQRQALRLPLEVLFGPCADKAARFFPEAGEVFLADQPVDQRKGVRGIGQQALGVLGADIRGLAGKALADIDPTADRAAIARTGAGAELIGFEHHRIDAVFGEFERGGQPRISAADDCGARALRQVDKISGLRSVSLPPIRCRCEIPVKDVGNHRPMLLACIRAMRATRLPPAARRD